MDNKMKNVVRAKFVKAIYDFVKNELEDDLGMITSGSFNFPIVEDGEEGWIEIVVKVTNDEDDEGYTKRDEYQEKLEKKKLTEEKRRKEKEKNIEKKKKKEKKGE